MMPSMVLDPSARQRHGHHRHNGKIWLWFWSIQERKRYVRNSPFKYQCPQKIFIVSRVKGCCVKTPVLIHPCVSIHLTGALLSKGIILIPLSFYSVSLVVMYLAVKANDGLPPCAPLPRPDTYTMQKRFWSQFFGRRNWIKFKIKNTKSYQITKNWNKSWPIQHHLFCAKIYDLWRLPIYGWGHS